MYGMVTGMVTGTVTGMVWFVWYVMVWYGMVWYVCVHTYIYIYILIFHSFFVVNMHHCF